MNNYLDFLIQRNSRNFRKDKSFVYRTRIVSHFSHNRIIFGAPGTGKSFQLKEQTAELIGDDNYNYERVTFHPAYSYAQFVGTYKPIPSQNEDGKEEITYKYVPGPFMRSYVRALESARSENPKPFLLIIEEINRVEVAAVFGDVFQLLDRSEGVSEYPIQASEDMKQYLMEQLEVSESQVSELKLPDNFFIWATMNSADQGVFPMDTAFKRRWNFEYLSLDEGEDKIAGFEFELGGSYYEWNSLRKALNEVLSSDFGINEDKLMGPFFLKLDEFKHESNNYEKAVSTENQTNEEGLVAEVVDLQLMNTDPKLLDSQKFIKAFKNKVLMYLFEDAAKQRRKQLFEGIENPNRYSKVCEEFESRGLEIFTRAVSDKYKELHTEG